MNNNFDESIVDNEKAFKKRFKKVPRPAFLDWNTVKVGKEWMTKACQDTNDDQWSPKEVLDLLRWIKSGRQVKVPESGADFERIVIELEIFAAIER